MLLYTMTDFIWKYTVERRDNKQFRYEAEHAEPKREKNNNKKIIEKGELEKISTPEG